MYASVVRLPVNLCGSSGKVTLPFDCDIGIAAIQPLLQVVDASEDVLYILLLKILMPDISWLLHASVNRQRAGISLWS